MPVPSAITDLTATAASNYPTGAENVFPDLDNYLRAHAGFIATLRDRDTSSTYTPTLTAVLNVAATTARTAQWMRVDNVVTVSFQFNATASAASAIQIGLSLPVASTLGNSWALAGSGSVSNGSGQYAPLFIFGDTSSNRAIIEYTASVTTSVPHSGTFTYRVI